MMIFFVVVVVRAVVVAVGSVAGGADGFAHPKGEDQNLNTVVSSPSPVHVQTD
jgi:hypothetical protein